jgi:glycosyltransferase involved in cell wall biosynthesis
MAETALIVSATSPVPVDSGKRTFLHGLLNYFVHRLGAANVHYAMLGQPGDQRPPFPGNAHRLDRPSSASQLRMLAHMVARDRSYTAQEAMLGSPELRRQIHGLAAWLRPTIEVYDTLRMGQHAPERPRAPRRILYLDDLFSVRYDAMLNFAAGNDVDIDPLGEFAVNVPIPLRTLVRRPAVYRAVLRMERDRIRRREDEIVHAFDANLLVNDHEVQALRQRSGASNIYKINDFLPAVNQPTRAPVDPPELVFLGRLNLPHNDDAICSFVRTSMRELERRLPGVTLRIIGRGATDALRALAALHPQSIRLEGFVDDLEPVLARATASLAPLRFGSGIKIKIMDALAHGLPVLATGTAIDGIPAVPDGGDGCIVADDLRQWPELLAKIAEPERNAEVSAAASAFFARTYGHDVVMAQYDQIFGLSGGGGVRTAAGSAPTA